jgi:hypothetical protein
MPSVSPTSNLTTELLTTPPFHLLDSVNVSEKAMHTREVEMVADYVSEVQLPESSSLQFIRAGVCNDILPMQPMLSLANICCLIPARPLLFTDGTAGVSGVISVDVAIAA